MRTIDVRGSDAELSALVAAAEQGEPTLIMIAGRPAAVLRSLDVFDKETEATRPIFGRFLLSFPGGLEESPTSTPLLTVEL